MWQKKIDLLKRHGYTAADIAAECGVTERTINRLRTGQHRDPAYSTGAKIVALELKVRAEKSSRRWNNK